MPRILTERVAGVSNDRNEVWKASVRWDMDTLIERWGGTCGEALRKLAFTLMQMEQIEEQNRKVKGEVA